MKKIVVIGGGFAGLSAAVFLADLGYKVEVLEGSPKLGGRAYSFIDGETNSEIDNGQHILMGCYAETIRFLKIIGAEKNFKFQERLRINFLTDRAKLYRLEATQLFYPLNLLFGLLNFEALNFIDRLILLKFFIRLYFYKDEDLKRLSVHQWLSMEKQNEKVRKAFWDLLVIGALNTSAEKASAKIFYDILKSIFFSNNKAATIILPSGGLSESYCIDAGRFIEKKGGIINLSEQVLNLEITGNNVNGIITSQRTLTGFDFIVGAVPWFALEKFYKDENVYTSFESSPILTIHLWLKENRLKEDFYGLIDSPVQWIFNHKDHITLVTSNAGNLIEKPGDELFELAADELKKYAEIKRNEIRAFKVVKEKRATFIPDNRITGRRPGTRTKIRNLFLAGDWINTGLPSTIESAVKSGRMAAEEIGKL